MSKPGFNPIEFEGIKNEAGHDRNTVEFLGMWESVHKPDFYSGEFAIIKSQAGLNSYKLRCKMINALMRQSWEVGRAVPCPPREGGGVTLILPLSDGGQGTARPTFPGPLMTDGLLNGI